ncbi:MAG: aminoacyl-histidine dipeptidase [Bacteroidaceae bacterium]|nr:aminoacyl-histidine dipeptidase [Bacteroidaceae bacterium]
MGKLNLKPQMVFDYFEQICEIPHASKHEEQISRFLQDFGKSLGLETIADEVGNVLIKKPASPGYEDRKTIILQGHMDMVCDKRKDVEHDFSKDAIKLIVDGEWLRADGTTLGADNGIGVAAGMALLADNTLKHGPVNCLFTIDEETGLTGAEALDAKLLQGDILINLDSEDEGEIFIGCAGGVCNYADFNYICEPIGGDLFFMKAEVLRLTGGHSGDDINKGRANANKLLARFLCRVAEKYEFYLCDIDGGSLHNAIPRDAWASFAVPSKDKESVRVDFNIFAAEVEQEYAATDPEMRLQLQSADPVSHAIDKECTRALLKSLHAVFNGVFAMSKDVPGLVETSSNLASVRRTDNMIKVTTSQRSSIESSRDDVSDTVRMAFELAGATVTTKGHYPGWKPNVNSEILKVACEQYSRLFGGEAKIKAIHAGLECGLFLEKAPHLDMISFGPTMRGVHSPDEKLNIPSTERFWQHLVAILENAPVKQ